MPKYRATFRDKPHTISRHYPNGWPEGKPPGFYGRMYYEDGPPQFKYEGPKQDKLYWLERPPYLPSFSKERPISGKDATFDTMRGLNMLPHPPEKTGQVHQRQHSPTIQSAGGYYTRHKPTTENRGHTTPNPTKHITQDGVGYL
jgi:hypothetical protein